jgi:F0F1-type ATP synthase assembly protein I
MALQLFGAILAGVLIGKWLDVRVANQRPFFAVFGAIFCLVAVLWHIFRQLLDDK